MNVTVEEVELKLSEVNDLIGRIPRKIELLKCEVDLLNKETQDILHKIELSTCNASEGYKLFRDLQITRQARRYAKDELDGLVKVDERLSRKSKFKVHTECSVKDIRDYKARLNRRKYRPKVRTDWNIYFKVDEEVKS